MQSISVVAKFHLLYTEVVIPPYQSLLQIFYLIIKTLFNYQPATFDIWRFLSSDVFIQYSKSIFVWRFHTTLHVANQATYSNKLAYKTIIQKNVHRVTLICYAMLTICKPLESVRYTRRTKNFRCKFIANTRILRRATCL